MHGMLPKVNEQWVGNKYLVAIVFVFVVVVVVVVC